MDISIVETQENCPVCDGPGALLGTLGNLNHYRCQNCGIGFNVPVEFKLDDDTTSAIAEVLGLK
jgi:transposase-like protein